MNLTVDVGNTRIKAAVFEGDTVLESFVFANGKIQDSIQNIVEKYRNIKNIIVSSVANVEKSDFFEFEKAINIHFITNENSFPFVNYYKTPKTLGVDRMILAAGATLQFPNQNRLVIDAGTCITYDFINDKNHYLGGAISPGLQLRYESLHNYTAKLPLLKPEIPTNFIGNSTSESIHSGISNGLVLEIDGFINELKIQYPKIIIILTGGDTEFLANRLKNTIFANSNFLLESLNQTFLYNLKND